MREKELQGKYYSEYFATLNALQLLKDHLIVPMVIKKIDGDYLVTEIDDELQFTPIQIVTVEDICFAKGSL